MARNKRSSGTAAEHNEETEADRQEARDHQAEVIDLLSPAARRAAEDKETEEFTDALMGLLDGLEDVKAAIRTLQDDYIARGRDWRGLVAMVKLRRMDDEKRERAESKARRQQEEEAKVRRAFGWTDGSQIDLFDAPAEGLIPGQQREYLGPVEAERDPAVAAALEAGFLTEEELSANGMDANGNVFEQDDGDDDDDESFDTLLEQAGVATVHADD